jgi:hypothetical protein
MKEPVKTSHAFHMGQWQMQCIGNLAECRAGYPVMLVLQLAQYLHQAVWRVVVAGQQCVDSCVVMIHRESIVERHVVKDKHNIFYHSCVLWQ